MRRFYLPFFLCCALSLSAHADTVKLELYPDTPLKAGEPERVVMTLSGDNSQPIAPGDLQEVHTQKIHLLLIDPTLTDYNHLHPKADEQAGRYVFTFTPKTDFPYRAWADVTLASGQHYYASANMGLPMAQQPPIDKTTVLNATQDGLTFALTFDNPLTAGSESMATLTVTKDGKPFKGLEPVMGAYAHLAGFSEDYVTIVHAHPLGDEPKTPGDRGGPALTFHIAPEVSGFVKLFMQLHVDGKDIFVPFGVTVK